MAGGQGRVAWSLARALPPTGREVAIDPDLDKAFAESAAFLDPILAGRIDGEWDPHRQTWT
jgi:hypothetical protein